MRLVASWKGGVYQRKVTYFPNIRMKRRESLCGPKTGPGFRPTWTSKAAAILD